MVKIYVFANSSVATSYIAIDDSYLFSTLPTIVSGSNTTQKMLRLVKRLRALICTSNIIALGILEEFKSQKVAIPEDIAVIAFDRYSFSQYIRSRLIAVDIDMFDI